MTKIDITSTAIEKGLDVVKSFLSKLLSPSVEETGLLLKDNITTWRFKRQIKLLKKTQEICERNNITTKAIPLKMISPILNYASLEEDESLFEKWAILLSNLVDTEKNIQNHVLPHLLSQISKNEFDILLTAYEDGENVRNEMKQRLKNLKRENEKREIEYKLEIQKLEDEIQKSSDEDENYEVLKIRKSLMENLIVSLIDPINNLLKEIHKPLDLEYSKLNNIEISNLLRLRLIERDVSRYGYVDSSSADAYIDYNRERVNLEDIHININDESFELYFTSLGEMFIQVCTEKSKMNT